MKNIFIESHEKILERINHNGIDEVNIFDYLPEMDKEIDSILGLYCVPQQTIVIHNLEFIHSVWGDALKLMQSYFTLGKELNEAFETVAQGKKIDKKSYALYMIQAKTMLTFRETLCLLENGYVDGAMAHFRSIYELFIVSHYIYSKPLVISEQFIDMAKKEVTNYQGDRQYIWAKEDIHDEKVINIETLINEVYDLGLWKSSLEDMSKRNFKKPYYVACKLVHPSPSGVIGRISTKGGYYGTAIEPSNYGLKMPAMLATIYTFEAQKMFWGQLSSALFQLGFSTMEKVRAKIIAELKQCENKMNSI